jgi:hypothetical protein
MSPSSRALVAALVIAGFPLAARTVGNGPWEAVPAAVDLAAMPLRIGDWNGRDLPLGEAVPAQADDALSSIQRAYTDRSGHSVSVMVDTFRASGIVHPPEICYLGTGASSIAAEDFSLAAAAGGKAPGGKAVARLLTFYRHGRRLHVLYWYQLGPHVFCDWSGLCRAQWLLGGTRRSFPLVKVMVQAPAGADAEKRLRSFAQPLLAWTLSIH